MNALMSHIDFKNGSEPLPQHWEGLAELDRALASDRMTAYRVRKAWADPAGRWLTISVGSLLTAFAAFVVYWDLIRG
jgi:hypothetical protein